MKSVADTLCHSAIYAAGLDHSGSRFEQSFDCARNAPVGDLRRNFSTHEFRCKHCGALRGPTEALLDVLQRLRDRVGRPLIIVSGYRCPTHNTRVGGATRSRHLAGDAADIPPAYVTEAGARAAGAVGIGVRDGWVVHIDTRPGRSVTFPE